MKTEENKKINLLTKEQLNNFKNMSMVDKSGETQDEVTAEKPDEAKHDKH